MNCFTFNQSASQCSHHIQLRNTKVYGHCSKEGAPPTCVPLRMGHLGASAVLTWLPAGWRAVDCGSGAPLSGAGIRAPLGPSCEPYHSLPGQRDTVKCRQAPCATAGSGVPRPGPGSSAWVPFPSSQRHTELREQSEKRARAAVQDTGY